MPAKKNISAALRTPQPLRTRKAAPSGGNHVDPVVERPLPALADDFMGWLITSLSVRLSQCASTYYMQRWDIGMTEYRLMMALGVEHECSAAFVAAAADVDKAAASRSLQVLSQQGLVTLARHGREMTISLTEAGQSLAEDLHTAARQRDAQLTQGMSAAQVKRLRADLRRLIANLPNLGDDSVDAAGVD
jgi:DNA-binding MarR family transcriptional regulator